MNKDILTVLLNQPTYFLTGSFPVCVLKPDQPPSAYKTTNVGGGGGGGSSFNFRKQLVNLQR